MESVKNVEESNNIETSNNSNSTTDTEKKQIQSKVIISKKMSMEDFKIIRNLGKGSYAKVVYAKNINNNKNYALKIIDKTLIEREEKVEEVHIEKQLLSQFDHPNIIKLYSTFHNKKKLFFVLELAEKSDLKEFITTQNIIPYDLAKFFTAEIVNGLEYIHSKGFAHRDIKPENIILKNDYHLKIIDFATAICVGKFFDLRDKKFKEEKPGNTKFRLIGTAEYISPEMISHGNSGFAGDLWALGCILYQFFHGVTPFYAQTEHLIMHNIVNRKMAKISSTLHEDARDLISKLLDYDSVKRLGAGLKNSENDYTALKNHKFFSGLDFDKLSSMDAPFKVNNMMSLTLNPDSYPNNELISNESSELANLFTFNLDMNYFEADEERKSMLCNEKIDVSIIDRKDLSLDDVIIKYLDCNSIKKDDIIYEQIVSKKSPWFHYNKRNLMLFPSKMEYYDPVKNVKKGEIPLCKACSAIFIDAHKFELNTPKRSYLFKVESVGSKDWVEKINCVIEELKK